MKGVSQNALGVLAATDFFTVELWTKRGLVRYHVLFVIKLATREVKIAGLVPEPSQSWMMQVVRNLVDPWAGFLHSSRFLMHDLATVLSDHFCQLRRDAKVESLRLPARSPNLNADAEPFVRTIREEYLDRMIFFGKASLQQTMREFVLHYNRERNHQALENKISQPEICGFPRRGRVRRQRRLGGFLNYYYREATG